MNKELEEFIHKELEKYPEKDVLVYYERISKLTWGFYIWNGIVHERTSITELREEGFEKSDIKELRNDAERFTVIEDHNGFRVEKEDGC